MEHSLHGSASNPIATFVRKHVGKAGELFQGERFAAPVAVDACAGKEGFHLRPALHRETEAEGSRGAEECIEQRLAALAERGPDEVKKAVFVADGYGTGNN